MKTTVILFSIAAVGFFVLNTGCKKRDAQAHVDAASARKSSPTFQVQAYQIDGETFLPPEKLSGTLTHYTGMVDMARISMEVKQLQELYRQAGYTNVRVVFPAQQVTNGILHLKAVNNTDTKD